ncbi:hypothetical protein OPV22_032153 [Ensete ventricosum]|uniref:Uncharacterized protein n=1 Tax=Ensete ventricosum TaxID=4639 RepID=A0AAV8PM97_ENSVE|nr:hypothetical protein OPV22_032153 [Ensete ventricosum]
MNARAPIEAALSVDVCVQSVAVRSIPGGNLWDSKWRNDNVAGDWWRLVFFMDVKRPDVSPQTVGEEQGILLTCALNLLGSS